jgi:hypothetical protein
MSEERSAVKLARENEQLRSALSSIVDRNANIVGSLVGINFPSHQEAFDALENARRLLSHGRNER